MNIESVNESAVPTPEFSGEGKPRRVWKKLTLADVEIVAAAVEREFGAACVKLKDIAPKIQLIDREFHAHPRGSIRIRGCRSFGEFCVKRLRRTRSAVYKMLASVRGYEKPLEKKARPAKPHKSGTAISQYDRQRRDCAAAAAIHLVEAEERGDAEAATKARDEIRFVVNAPQRSAILGTYDVRQEVLALKRTLIKLQKLVLKLLGEIMKADKYQPLPADLMRVAATLRTELAVDAKSLGLDDGSVQ